MAVHRFVRVETSPHDYSASLWQIKLTLVASATEDMVIPTEDIIDVSWSWDTTEPTISATTWPITDIDANTAHWDVIDPTFQINPAVTGIRFVGGVSDTELSVTARVRGV